MQLHSIAEASTLAGESGGLGPASIDRRMVFAAVAQQLLGDGAPPVTIGRFVLIERIGSGSFGTVYAAFDPRLQRRIALKLIDRPLADPAAVARVEHEAQAAAALAHPNVVAVHDVGDVNGRLYIAMEFVEGTTLTSWMRRRGLSWRAKVEMFVTIAAGLQAAHDARIVHRDFKPDNVLVGNDGRPRIADFGLATALPTAESLPTEPGNVATSRTTHAVGTPAFMSPEMFAGRRAGPPSDQFSFCVALYEALFGHRPFPGDNVHQLADEVMRGQVLPAGRGVPRAVTAAVRRGLSVDPEARFASMSELGDALRRALARRRSWLLAGVAMALASIGITAGAKLGSQVDPCEDVADAIDPYWPAERGGRFAAAAAGDENRRTLGERVERYVSTWRAARYDACAATMARGEQSPLLMEMRGACLEQRLVGFATLLEGVDDGLDPGTAAPLVDDATAALAFCSDEAALMEGGANRFARVTDRARDVANEGAWVAGSERIEQARALAGMGRSREAGALAQAVAADAHAAGLRGIEAEALLEWATAEMTDGELDGPAERLDRAIELALAAGHATIAFDALLGRVRLALMRGKVTPSDQLRLQFADALLVRIDDDQRRVRLLESRGLVADAEGDVTRADELLTAAVELAGTAYPPGHLNSISPRNNLAGVALARGELARAHSLWTAVLDDAETRLGPNHPDAVAPAFNLGVVELGREHHEEAARWFALAQERWSAELGAMHPLVALALGGHGEAMRRSRRLLAARVLQSQSLAIRERVLGADHPEVATALEELAMIDRAEGRLADAHIRIDRALVIREASQGTDHADLAIALGLRAEVLCDEGRAVEALPQIERALRVRLRPGLDPAKSVQLHAIALRAQLGAVSPSPGRPTDRGSKRPSGRTPPA